MKYPPILISVVGFFAALAGFGWLVTGFRMLGFDWFGILGDLPKFEQTGFWGWLAVIAGVAWLAAAVGLWSLRPWAWALAVVVAGFSLFESFLWFLEYPGQGVGLATALLPLVMIFYLNSQSVKEAFGLAGRPYIADSE